VDISYIFSREGEAGFRVREREVIEDITRESPIVLATGGGAILMEENRKVLHERGFVAYLCTSIEQQAERVRQGRNRPLLHDVDPLTKLTELMAIRAPLYESLADYTIATDGRKVHAVADSIYAAFKAARQPA
jgi:shikimate kinase